jgi:hypothetical protein
VWIGQELVEIQRTPERQRLMALGITRPRLRRPVPHQLERVPVGVDEIDRVVSAVGLGLTDRPADRLQPPVGVSEPDSGGVGDGDVMQAGVAVGHRLAVLRLPRVEREMVVVAARGQEQDVTGGAPTGNVTALGDDIEAEHIDVELTDAIDVGRSQVCVTEAYARVDRIGRPVDGH